jgi:hypothetical protein
MDSAEQYKSPPLPEPMSKAQCPHCGHTLREEGEQCRHCHDAFSAVAARGHRLTLINPLTGNGRGQFSLETLMLVVTLASVLLAVSVALPEIGLLAAFIAAPAALRAMALDRQFRTSGKQLTISTRVQHFLISFGVLFAIGWASMLAGFGGMAAGLAVMELFGAIAGNRAFGNESMLISLVPALLIGGWCMWRLVSETWPKEYVPRRPQTVDSPMSSD